MVNKGITCSDALNCTYNGIPTIGCGEKKRLVTKNCPRNGTKVIHTGENLT